MICTTMTFITHTTLISSHIFFSLFSILTLYFEAMTDDFQLNDNRLFYCVWLCATPRIPLDERHRNNDNSNWVFVCATCFRPKHGPQCVVGKLSAGFLCTECALVNLLNKGPSATCQMNPLKVYAASRVPMIVLNWIIMLMVVKITLSNHTH